MTAKSSGEGICRTTSWVVSSSTVITVLDETTHEVVRQIPSPELLAVMRHLERVGTLLDIHG